VEVVPAGVAQTAFRQTFATVRINPTRSTNFNGNLHLTYQRVTTAQEKFNVMFASLSSQQLIRWGQGFLMPQYETRALRLTEPNLTPPTSATILVTVFEDANRNGKLDAGEVPVTPSFVEVGGRRFRTNSKGEVSVNVPPGKYVVRVLP